MTETPKRPEDLVRLAEDRLEKQREQDEAQREGRLKQAREALGSALPEGAWEIFGISPDAAEPRDSGVFAEGSFEYAGEEWSCEAYASGNQRDGARLTVHLGYDFVLREQLKTPHYPNDASTYQADNAAAVGSLLASLTTQKAQAAEKRAAEEKARADKALSAAAHAFNTTYSAAYLRRNLADADEHRDAIPDGAPQRERLEQMIAAAEAAADQMEAEAAERDRRLAEVQEKLKAVAAEHLAAADRYDVECRRHAEEMAGAHFFAWSAREVRYCPAFTARALVALAGHTPGGVSAGSYAGDPESEYGAAYDAVREALIQKTIALPGTARAAADQESGSCLFEKLGYDGARTPLLIGAFLDSTEKPFAEHDPSEEMAYHRTVRVGRSFVNLPPLLRDLESVAARIKESAPEEPRDFRDRLEAADVSEEDLEILPYEARSAAERGAYRYLVGEPENFDPYDADIPF